MFFSQSTKHCHLIFTIAKDLAYENSSVNVVKFNLQLAAIVLSIDISNSLAKHGCSGVRLGYL